MPRAVRNRGLAGVVSAYSILPVLGVPMESPALKGLDSLLAISQMPGGVPVATVAIGGGRNAGLLAVQILGARDAKLRARVSEFKRKLAAESAAKPVETVLELLCRLSWRRRLCALD